VLLFVRNVNAAKVSIIGNCWCRNKLELPQNQNANLLTSGNVHCSSKLRQLGKEIRRFMQKLSLAALGLLSRHAFLNVSQAAALSKELCASQERCIN